MLQHQATHYRAWVDEPVSGLDGQTPRAGARERRSKPPAAECFRSLPSFSDTATTLTEEELSLDLALQRFLRLERTFAGDSGREEALAAPYLPLMVNLDLHRRKRFWVDAALSYMLENTEVDVAGRELRTPFPSFAIVLTDRHALSLGERLLARHPDDPLRGQILLVVTVYVTERPGGEERLLSIAFDALGADLPSLVRYEVPAGDEQSLRAFLDSVAPRPVTEPEVRDSSPARGLLRLVLNAILYATSAGVTPEHRSLARRARPANSSASRPLESDSVFFLPGTIDIRRVRNSKISRGRSQKGDGIGDHVRAGRPATGFELLPGGKHLGRR